MIDERERRRRDQMIYILNTAAWHLEKGGRLGHGTHPHEGLSVEQALRLAAGATHKDKTLTVSMEYMSTYLDVMLLLAEHYGPPADLDVDSGTPVLFRLIAEWILTQD